MAPDNQAQAPYDCNSVVVEISSYDTHGLSTNYTLRRHKFESDVNVGSHEARRDWIRYIGPIEQFGGCNPINGNFTAVVFPLCIPKRIRLVAYVMEYAFLYDNVLESVTKATLNVGSDGLVLDEAESISTRSVLGTKQMQAKMIFELTSIDKKCAERVIDFWKIMVSTTMRDKSKRFESLEDYVEFRIIDTGAPFVESMMLWGMGMTLSKEEDEQLKSVIHPCYAALGLANDYFSFDREYEELKDSAGESLTNCVWLFMQWHNLSVEAAKKRVKEVTIDYETQFLTLCDEYRATHAPVSDKIDRYLIALSYQISGNTVWSLNCPRYHPEFRYDPNANLENQLMAKHFSSNTAVKAKPLMLIKTPVEHFSKTETSSDDCITIGNKLRTQSITSLDSGYSGTTDSSDNNSTSAFSSNPTTPPNELQENLEPLSSFKKAGLGLEHVQGPYDYIKSLPSKGLRDAFSDAINVWYHVPERTVSQIKSIIDRLHSASLMLDDIEDCSNLRRGKPATHTVYGLAQTINAANFAIIKAIEEVKHLDNPQAMEIVLAELKDLHIGQSHDLHWTRHAVCPSEEEYMDMVSKKTGGLFRLLTRLLYIHRSTKQADVSVDDLVTLVGLFYQIRDDYQNLNSAEYTSQKGFCEDLDEGKLSFPLTHALNQKPENLQIREILQQRRDEGGLSKPLKLLVLEELGRVGSMDYSKKVLVQLQSRIEQENKALEKSSGCENWIMRMFLQKLRI